MTQYETFKVKMNADEIVNKLNELTYKIADLKPMLRVVRQSLLTDIDDNFETEGQASGEKWEELSPKYLKKKLKEKKINKILHWNGDLRKNFYSKVTNNSLIIAPEQQDYASVHNFGYEDRNIPQREFMRLSDEQLDDVLDEIEAYYLKNYDYISK